MTIPSNQSNRTILLLSATAGAGHFRAAEALAETAQALNLPVTVRHEDILNYTFGFFKNFYSKIQFAITDTSPELWGYLYRKTEFEGYGKNKSPLARLFGNFNYRRYHKLLGAVRPDAMVCTHFLPYTAIENELQKSDWRIPVFSVTTDYELHSLWLSPSVKRYYVASDQGAWTLRGHGISTERIVVTGIPVLPQFTEKGEQQAARKELGLGTDVFTILILSGGYGVGVVNELTLSVEDFLSTLAPRRFQLLVSSARNAALHRKLEQLPHPPNVDMKVFQFVPYVGKLMDAADVLISKAGGLTVTEAMVKHLPLIIFDPTPGQENRNAIYLMERGAAVSATSFTNLNFKLGQTIENPALLKRMKANAQQIARPDAAKDILEDILRQLG
ncbi:MAG TPA: glycosyltransferase [Bacteroidota bacterium]|nr:glycosyltransferase [Bacteroidota bacterium]